MTSQGAIERENITGLILAGGKGSRMGGVDKGLVLYRGRPLVEYVIGTMKPQCAGLLLSVNRSEEAYARYGIAMVRDAEAGFPGPLAGFAAALERIETDYLAVAPCDSPFLPADYVERLARALAGHPDRLAAAARTAGREQAVFVLLSKKALPLVKEALKEGRLAVHRWLNETVHAVWVDFEDGHAFENMNRPEDLLDESSK